MRSTYWEREPAQKWSRLGSFQISKWRTRGSFTGPPAAAFGLR